MTELEKIRDVPVSITPVAGAKTECLRLIIPVTVVEKLNIQPTKRCGKKASLYASPPLDQIKEGEPFDLIYRFKGYDVDEEQVDISDEEIEKDELQDSKDITF